MSGTSADAIDAVLYQHSDSGRGQILAHSQSPLSGALRKNIHQLSSFEQDSLRLCLELDATMGEEFAAAVRTLLEHAGVEAASVRAIGSHGQTIRHEPPEKETPDKLCYSLQIGDPNRIAEITGIDVVADFRRRDIAAGGQAAPLVPAFHAAWFGATNENRVIVNLGGIANLTLLEGQTCVGGYDSGPANGLMNAWINHQLDLPMDRDGQWAASGSVIEPLLSRWLEHPWFAKASPKSTGLEQFNLAWVQSAIDANCNPRDVQRTLLELSAKSLTQAIRSNSFNPDRVILCGGGCRNPLLVKRICELLEPTPVELCESYGIAAEQVEATAFAWLAARRLEMKSGNEPAVTGASGYRVLGSIFPGN